jgi:hypothetical protein
VDKISQKSDQTALSRSWHTDLGYGLYRLPDLEVGFTAGVTGRQGMLTPLRRLIPPLMYARSFSDLYFLQDLWDRLLFIIHSISYYCRNGSFASPAPIESRNPWWRFNIRCSYRFIYRTTIVEFWSDIIESNIDVAVKMHCLFWIYLIDLLKRIGNKLWQLTSPLMCCT